MGSNPILCTIISINFFIFLNVIPDLRSLRVLEYTEQ